MLTLAEICRNLAHSSDREVRDDALVYLKAHLIAIAPTSLSYRKLWKGLWFYIWHSDKPDYQEQVAQDVASLVLLLPSASPSPPPPRKRSRTSHSSTQDHSAGSLLAKAKEEKRDARTLWLDSFLSTCAIMWWNVDHQRMNKYLRLLRLMLRTLLPVWQESFAELFRAAIMTCDVTGCLPQAFGGASTSTAESNGESSAVLNVPPGVVMQLVDVAHEESLAFAGLGEYDTDPNIAFVSAAGVHLGGAPGERSPFMPWMPLPKKRVRTAARKLRLEQMDAAVKQLLEEESKLVFRDASEGASDVAAKAAASAASPPSPLYFDVFLPVALFHPNKGLRLRIMKKVFMPAAPYLPRAPFEAAANSVTTPDVARPALMKLLDNMPGADHFPKPSDPLRSGTMVNHRLPKWLKKQTKRRAGLIGPHGGAAPATTVSAVEKAIERSRVHARDRALSHAKHRDRAGARKDAEAIAGAMSAVESEELPAARGKRVRVPTPASGPSGGASAHKGARIPKSKAAPSRKS